MDPANGVDFLARMAAKAAGHASAHLSGDVRLARCEASEMDGACPPGESDLESWAVASAPHQVVIAVFATVPQQGGGRRIAGAGRFTFDAISRADRQSLNGSAGRKTSGG
jgi:hypothetical protein